MYLIVRLMIGKWKVRLALINLILPNLDNILLKYVKQKNRYYYKH